MEEWKDIEGYEGLYKISSLGRIKSIKRFKTGRNENLYTVNEKIRKTTLHRCGYEKIILIKNSKQKVFFVHRLVAKAFIPNPDNLPEVNHKDENKINNRVDNLEWCSRKYNMNYGTINEKKSNKLKGVYNNKRSKPVICVETGIIYPSSMEVQRQHNFDHSNIEKCCNNKPKYKTAYGYHWKYLEKGDLTATL